MCLPKPELLKYLLLKFHEFLSLVFLHCPLSNFVVFLSLPFPKRHIWGFPAEEFCLLFHIFYFLVSFLFQIKSLFIFQFCPRIHQKKISHRSICKRPSSPTPWLTSKFNKAQRVNDLLKVIIGGRARVGFAFSDS